MKQLAFPFSRSHRALFPIIPQPYQRWDEASWFWNYSCAGASLVMPRPETSPGMLDLCPFKLYSEYLGEIITGIKVLHTPSKGWLWELTFDTIEEEPLQNYWGLLLDLNLGTEYSHCILCGGRHDLELVPNYRIYDPLLKEFPNETVYIHKKCTSYYRNTWLEAWNDYLNRDPMEGIEEDGYEGL